MGLGSTTKKIQRLGEVAEKLYELVIEMRQQVQELRERVEDTDERIHAIERNAREQRALIKAIAEEQGLDVEEIVADVEHPEDEETESGDEADVEDTDAENADSDAKADSDGATKKGEQAAE